MEDGDSDTDKYPHRTGLTKRAGGKISFGFFYSLVTGYAYIQTRLQPHVNVLRKISLRKISHNIYPPYTSKPLFFSNK